jgi:hypothetical protein
MKICSSFTLSWIWNPIPQTPFHLDPETLVNGHVPVPTEYD